MYTRDEVRGFDELWIGLSNVKSRYEIKRSHDSKGRENGIIVYRNERSELKACSDDLIPVCTFIDDGHEDGRIYSAIRFDRGYHFRFRCTLPTAPFMWDPSLETLKMQQRTMADAGSMEMIIRLPSGNTMKLYITDFTDREKLSCTTAQVTVRKKNGFCEFLVGEMTVQSNGEIVVSTRGETVGYGSGNDNL